jgi:hypothetical protein
MSPRLLTVLACLAGFGIAAQAPSTEILARVISKDGAGELTLTREKIVYRVNSAKLVIRLSVRDVKDVVRKDQVLIVEIVDAGMHSDPLTVQVSDLAAADDFVKAFHGLRRRE